jgi:hypothetical protein
MARTSSSAPKRVYVRMTRWRRRRFLMLLAECGTVRVAADLAGVGIGAVYRLRKKEPGFAAEIVAAKAAASARLAARRDDGSDSPFPEERGELAGLVIRRGAGGQLRLIAPGRPWWEPRHDGIFLRALRGTGNVTAAARAAGFTPKVAYDRMKACPAFAAACAAARAEANPRLEDLLALQSVRWSRAAYDEAFEGEPLDEHDVERAIRTLEYWDRKERRRGAGGG